MACRGQDMREGQKLLWILKDAAYKARGGENGMTQGVGWKELGIWGRGEQEEKCSA